MEDLADEINHLGAACGRWRSGPRDGGGGWSISQGQQTPIQSNRSGLQATTPTSSIADLHRNLQLMEDLADENLHLGVACGRWRSLQAQTRGGWSDLHEDVLYQIMCRLPSIHDCLSLAAVSHHWRGAVYLRLPCSLPKLCLALPDGTFYTFQPGDSSVLKRRDDLPRRGSYCGATGSRLLSSSDGCSVYRLVNPFTGRDRLLPVPYGIPVPAHDVIVVREPADAEEDRLLIEEEIPVRKLVFGPDGLVAAIVGHHEHSAKVALICAANSAAWSWSIDAGDSWRWYVDMAFFDGNLYGLTNDGNLLALEVNYDGGGKPRISNVQQVIDGGTCSYTLQEYTGMRYLVVRPGGRGLLMVCRIMLDNGMTTYDFAVFQADLASSSWVELKTLGGNEALFVGRLCSRAVRADRHGVRGDQIFFLDDSPGMEQYLCDAFANVYDMKYGSVSELLSMHSYGDAEVPATWLFREDADAEE